MVRKYADSFYPPRVEFSISPFAALPDSAALTAQIRGWALELGFADAGVARLDLDTDVDHLRRWLDEGLHGDLAYMSRNLDLRQSPIRLHPGTLSVLSLRLDYRAAAADAESVLADGQLAYISRYALGRDYHKLIRARLVKLAARIEQAFGASGHRVFADSAPVLEKALARNAGLGWIGKNTLVLNRNAGSWFFLGEIYTDLPLAPSSPDNGEQLCGSCSACLRICPTQAFVAPYRLDARRCISYLTIENRGPIPLELRPLIGNRVFGCDDCQLACPWNRYARLSDERDFAPRNGLDAARLVDLFGWSETEWLKKTEGMALRRAGYSGFMRNLAVALGNAPADAAALTVLESRSGYTDAILAEHIAWAAERQRGKLRELQRPS